MRQTEVSLNKRDRRIVDEFRAKGLHMAARPGKPKRYEADAEAQVTALACSDPPSGAQRWSVALLTEAARRHPQMKTISRETIRRILKKTSSNPGAS
jgi:hypothetical protein